MVVILISSFYIMVCSTTKYVPYTFAENENVQAEIYFSWRVDFVDLEGEQLPDSEERTVWFPLYFPAGRSFNIKVHVYNDGWVSRWMPIFNASAIIDDEIIFECPPLEAGGKYQLWYDYDFSNSEKSLIFRKSEKGRRVIISQKIII